MYAWTVHQTLFDLIKPVSNVHPSVHTYDGMHNGMQYDPIQGQGHEPFRVWNPAIFNSYLLRHLHWDLATDHVFLNWDTISKFDLAGFLKFFLVFVLHDFELGRHVSCDESTVSPVRG